MEKSSSIDAGAWRNEKKNLSFFMLLEISLAADRCKLLLREGKTIVASRKFPVDGDMSGRALLELDAMLRDAGKTPDDLEDAVYVSSNAGFTADRVGNVITDTIRFCLGKSGDVNG